MEINGVTPEWTITGARLPDEHVRFPGGVQIIASQELDGGAFEKGFGQPTVSFTVRMKRLMVVEGADYQTAMRHLFDTWSPDLNPAGIAGQSE